MSIQSTSDDQPNNVNTELWGKGAKETGLDSYGHLPVRITGSLTPEQISAYQTMFRIQEITSTLRSNDIQPPTRRNRSPSPPPAYDPRGKRINTREQRYKRKLEEERHRLVEIALKMIPHFVAPEDYKRPVKFQDKYYIPVESYPGINFVGLLLGPRGNTLKKLQEDSGCKIAIRGRGSVKEGKNANDLPRGAMNFSDPLHCLIIADTEEKIQKGIKVCENIVVKAVTSPEGQNDLKRGQLRELAELNGTLREDNRPCPICGLQGHKKYECPNMETFAQKVICRRCGQHGHATMDCVMTIQGQGQPQNESRYSRYGGGDFSHNARNWGEPGLPHDYHSSQTAVAQPTAGSYRSRQSRGIHGDVSQSQKASHIPELSSHAQNYGEKELTERLTSPPGMDAHMAPLPVSWGVPGMSSLPEPSTKPTSTSSSVSFPPGMNASLSSGNSGLESLPTLPGLSGPPGLSESKEGSETPLQLNGPPGL